MSKKCSDAGIRTAAACCKLNEKKECKWIVQIKILNAPRVEIVKIVMPLGKWEIAIVTAMVNMITVKNRSPTKASQLKEISKNEKA